MNDTFEIVPPSSSAIIVFICIIGLLGAMTLLFSWMSYKSMRTSISVRDDKLILDTAIYGRSVPLSMIKHQEVEIIDLGKGSPWEPQIRSNGIGLPGLQIGWFSLRNGERALLAVTDRSRAVRIPVNDGYTIIASVNHPERLVGLLKQALESYRP